MKVVVSGATGLLGTHLVARLTRSGHDVVALVRADQSVLGATSVRWDAAQGVPERAREGADVIVNLAGENIGARRWTAARRASLASSRLDATNACVGALGDGGPIALVNASAVGFYGATEDPVDEASPPGAGELAALCVRWEAAARAGEAHGHRVVLARYGVVLARDGGALPRIAALARFGANGPIGGGRQWVSWVHVDDAVAATELLATTGWRGPVNVVAPTAVRQRDLARALGAVLHRPWLLPAPSIGLRAAIGRGPASLVLEGQSVLPNVLLASGFEFGHPTLEDALRNLLG